MDWSTCPAHEPAPEEGGIVAHIEDVEEAHAICGLFWAIRLWLERAWADRESYLAATPLACVMFDLHKRVRAR